jgi:hypothetical protein
MDMSVTDSISQGFPFLPSSLSSFAPMIPRSGSFAMASSRPAGATLRITKTNVTVGQQDLSRRCEDDGHPWPWSSLSLPNPPTPSRSTRYIFISPPSLLVPYPSDTSEAIIASHDPRCEVRPSPCRPFVPSRPETGFSQGGAVERGSMGSEVFYARNNQTEKQKESLALIRPVRFFRHRVRVSRGHLRRIGRMTTTSDRAINEEQKTLCEACKACEESNEKALVDLARCSVVLVLSARTLSVDQ